MKIFKRITAVSMLVLSCVVISFAQNTTNLGTEFWTAYMSHNLGASQDGTGQDGGSLMSLYITSTINTSGTITINDGSFKPIPFQVAANQVTIVTIPPVAYLYTPGTANKGLHITSLKPIAIYAHIYAFSVSGATLLLPVNTLGNDYQSINYEQVSNAKPDTPAYSSFAVVATADNTSVQINPAGALIDNHPAGTPFTISLKKGEVYQGLSQDDLTGSKITALNASTGGCVKVAFFSGSTRIEIGCNPKYRTSDNLFQQVYPTASWGKNYITVPLDNRNYDEFRIILSNPATTTDPGVNINGTPIPLSMFNAGYYTFPSQTPNVITSTQPIQVVQYAVTEHNTIDCSAYGGDLGDPEMIFLNPLEQTVNRVTLYSTGNFQIFESYINVVIKTAAVPTFILDGKPYTSFSPVPNNSNYSYAKIPVQSGPQDVQVSAGSQGVHTISAGDGFNAIAYGFGDVESYGYAAGTNLQNLNENIALISPANDTLAQTNGCAGVAYKLQLTLPYQTTNIIWDFKNGTTYTDNAPKVISTVTKGSQTLYHYQYYKPVTYKLPGDTSVTATVFNPVAGTCGNTEVVEFDFNISSPPAAAFVSTNSCLGDSTIFTDQSSVNGSYIKTWLWDFGDETTAAVQNPVHLYANPGKYNVVLTVTNVNGCESMIQHPVQITAKPLAAFVASAPDCNGQDVFFTDKSNSADGQIIQWIWSYGDGKVDTLTTNTSVKHSYANPGIDTVKLTVVSGSGCKSTPAIQTITLNADPQVDFILPAICLSDSYAQFTDNSTIADHTQSSFTYLWNFGDPNANAANPNTSTQQNPQHKYTAASNYNVTLTVTSKYGCIASKTLPFTVNGDIPAAAFSVENNDNLCSADNVIFDDQSTVNFGSPTKLIWYFDYNNNPQDTTVFLKDKLAPDRKYNHNYSLFNSPQTRTYTVRLDAYSGITCVNTSYKSIIIKANPLVNLGVIGPFCRDSQPVQIMEDKNGFTGTGLFTGTGVTSSGLFDPSVSGQGTFTINYKFTAQNGCDYSTSEQVIVNKAPVISTGADITVLLGAQVTLPAKANTDSLTYLWTPSAGLDQVNVLNPVASPAVTTIYKLVATNAAGCTAASEITINIIQTPAIPNAFTPNGDGINDTWDIKYLDTYVNGTVDIFNRYGEKVFTSVGYPVPWDGRYRGAELPTGTYYYIINPRNGRSVLSGNVTIIR